MKKKAYELWWAMFPYNSVALSFRWGALTEREFRIQLREWCHRKNLRGVQIWHG